MATTTHRLVIEAPAVRVWAVLTEPTLVKQWQYGSDLITDWRVGGDIRFRSAWNGQVFEQWGTIQEVVPYRRIRYSLFAPAPGREDRPENYFVMTYHLDEHQGATTLTFEMDDNRPPDGTTASADDGGSSVLAALKAVAEAR